MTMRNFKRHHQFAWLQGLLTSFGISGLLVLGAAVLWLGGGKAHGQSKNPVGSPILQTQGVLPDPPMAPPAVQPPPPRQGVPPRVLPFPRRPGRLPLLPGVPPKLGKTPNPSKKDHEEFEKIVLGFTDPKHTVDVIINRPRLMRLSAVPTQTQIGDAEILALRQLQNAKHVSLLGQQVGTTVLNLWFKDPDNPNQEKILSMLVRVLPDPELKERIEQVYEALATEINERFPDSVIKIRLIGDKVAVSGQAKDIAEATQILRIVRANAPQEDDERTSDIPVSLNVNIPPNALNAPGGLPTIEDFLLAGGPNVINLIRIPGEQQVMLKVAVAEINRAAARSIGVNFSITNNQGITVFNQRTGNIASGGSAALLAGGVGNQGRLGQLTNNLPVLLDNGQISLAINALRTLNYARSLAEPNLVAINGQTASFQAGGSFPVPVVAAGGGFGGIGQASGNLQGVSFVPFGVLLNFTPFITDKDRIRLTVAAEVSTRNLGSGTNIGGANVSGLNTRNFQTTVELREGQTLAVAGLIQNNLGGDAQRVPLFGDLPVVGRLFGFDRITSGEQELVVLVTPEIVTPLDPNEVPALPGSDVFEPDDLEFYLHGRLESRRSQDYRAPVRTDIHRIKAYRHCEDSYIYGPTGHSEAKDLVVDH